MHSTYKQEKELVDNKHIVLLRIKIVLKRHRQIILEIQRIKNRFLNLTRNDAIVRASVARSHACRAGCRPRSWGPGCR